MVRKVAFKDFDKTVKHGDWVIDFYTDHCGPCKMLDVVLDEVLFDNPIVNLAKCNIEDDPEYVQRFEVEGTPTVLFYHEGIEKQRFFGAQDRETIIKCLSASMYD